MFNVDAISVTRRFSTLRNRLAGFVEWKTGKPARRFRSHCEIQNRPRSYIQCRRNEFESGGHRSGAKRRKIFIGGVPPLFGSTSTISRFAERFHDGQYSLASFLIAQLIPEGPQIVFVRKAIAVCLTSSLLRRRLLQKTHCLASVNGVK